jgi:phage-related protein
MKKNFIAYKGTKFEIEWYFDDRGRSDVLDYFGNLSIDRQKKLFYLLRHLGDKGKIFNIEKFRNENDQIYAIKPAPDRFLCFFFEGSKIIITNAYEKKTDKMPPREKERALKSKADYIQRCKKGIYYDQKD